MNFRVCYLVESCHKILDRFVKSENTHLKLVCPLQLYLISLFSFSFHLYFQRNTGAEGEVSRETQCVAIARVGAKDQKMASGTLEELAKVDLGAPLHCFIVTGKLHPMEEEFLAKLVPQES